MGVNVRLVPVLVALAAACAGAARAERPDVRDGHRLGNMPRSQIVGEVRVISPARPGRGHTPRHHAPALHIRVPLTISDPRTGTSLERTSVVTDERFAIAVAPGTYRVSAQIGSPAINPRARSCGAAVVRAHLRRGGRVLLFCTLTG